MNRPDSAPDGAAGAETSAARAAVDAAYFADESAVVRERLAEIGLDAAARGRVESRAAGWVSALRGDPSPGLIESFLAEYGLSTEEGVALMCLAEAFLRVPDAPTLDALIRDKIGGADWSRHRGDADSLLINASTWALMLTGGLYRDGEPAERQVAANLRRLVRRVGEPVVRAAVSGAMKVMAEQFVLGATIEDALDAARRWTADGYTFSFDMLGEAARTEGDARRYFLAYSRAITEIAAHAGGVPAHAAPGISVKLSALHPRYEALQRERVMAELVPRLSALVEQARNAGIGFAVDAEEADRLALSLEVVEAVLANRDLAGWDGFGVVVQAYSKQCRAALDWAAALAGTLGRRLAVRLVKGAYWDTEVKHAQVLGLAGYPVFTRKSSTDVSYLAAVRFLLDRPARFYPQLATHNAHTVAAVLEMAGTHADLELQRLHGMGEQLHERVRRETGRRCRIYAPVGIHRDLLAYLVRRLLENGASSSFVHQLLDDDVPVSRLVRDPVAAAEALAGEQRLPHPRIPSPPDLFAPSRRSARGWNLDNPLHAAELEAAMSPFRDAGWTAGPTGGGGIGRDPGPEVAVHDPADRRARVGTVRYASPADVEAALAHASAAFPAWRDRGVEERAELLERIADRYEDNAPELIALLAREAGKTRLDGVLEVREAVDFCRYYAAEARTKLHRRRGRGPIVCISPWNFPLAIFTGQVAAALVAGNTVIAKPAEQTSLVGARAHALMHEAGVPEPVLALLPGDGPTVGGRLVGDRRVAGVCFTGSLATAIGIDRALAAVGTAPLVAETGGLNAMIVDSTALPEAAVRDIVASAYQSAGQRCSALRALFVQREVAGRILPMLEGAMRELALGHPWLPAVDVGPVIDDDAQATIAAHCAGFAARGRELFRHPCEPLLGAAHGHGRFAAPCAFRLERFEELEREVFGPVLHVVEFAGDALGQVVEAVNASGYGLTLGIHSRLDDRVQWICERARVGNVYVNRNQIGAMVGVQPFGGEGLSGTGPKAGGPGYLLRLGTAAGGRAPDGGRAPVEAAFAGSLDAANSPDPGMSADTGPARAAADWDRRPDRAAVLRAAIASLPERLRPIAAASLAASHPFFEPADPLPGPTGESNHLTLHGRGIALCLGPGEGALTRAIAALSSGSAVVLAGAEANDIGAALANALERAGAPSGLVALRPRETPEAVAARCPDLGIALVDPVADAGAVRRALAARPGRRVPLVAPTDGIELIAAERVVSIDTTASGGNTSLLTLEEPEPAAAPRKTAPI